MVTNLGGQISKLPYSTFIQHTGILKWYGGRRISAESDTHVNNSELLSSNSRVYEAQLL